MKKITVVTLLFLMWLPGVVSAMPLQQYVLTATPISSTQVALEWYHQPLSSGSYTIYREVLAAGTCSSISDLPSENIIAVLEVSAEPTGPHQYTDSGLTTGTSYCYSVRFQSHVDGHADETVTFGPSVATPLVVSTPTATSTRTPTPTSTPTVTGTPLATSTPAPYHPATIAPPELQTLSNQCIVADYHFIKPSDQPWNKSAGASWTYSRWVLSSTASINQVVSFPSSGQYVMSIRASSPITPALISVSVFSATHSISTTRTSMASYAITVTIPTTQSGVIKIMAPTNSSLTLDRVCFMTLDNARSIGFGTGGPFESIDPAGSLDLNDFVDWFTPLELRTMFSNPFSGWDWNVTMGLVARIATTLMIITLPNFMQYYFAARIGLLAATWFFSFVAKRIGHPLPGGESSVVVLGRNTGLSIPKHLPSLGPSVLRGGRGRGRGI